MNEQHWTYYDNAVKVLRETISILDKAQTNKCLQRIEHVYTYMTSHHPFLNNWKNNSSTRREARYGEKEKARALMCLLDLCAGADFQYTLECSCI